jgi:hypothetical protein
MACGKCGQEHIAGCTAHKRYESPGVEFPDGPRPCGNRPMHGQAICHAHGGRAKHNKAAGATRETERKALAIMQTYGRPIETTATEALLDEVKWTAGYVAWLREQVGQLDEAALIWGKTKTVEGDVVVGDGASAALEKASTTTEEAKPHIYRQMLMEERAHLVKVCSEALRAGIEERKVRLAEQQGALVADAIKQILDALNLTPEQLRLVPEVVPRALRLIA